MITRAELLKIVDSRNVCDEQVTHNTYLENMSFVNPLRPEYIVRPHNADEIQRIVKLANDRGTPLVPVSSGPLHFRGDTVPSLGGAIIVDLSGMKKIMYIDQVRRVAIVEPGVTFYELIPELKREGLRLNMPLLPRKSKSVVASMLEREPVIMPKYHWDIGDPLACVEVIFGNGEMFRTGQAAGPGTLEEQREAGGAQKEAAGPAQASLHRLIQGAQGTMGIVTWASFRCELLPRIEEPFLIGSSQLSKILEMLHWLVRLRLVNECFVLNCSNMSAILAREWPHDYHNLKDMMSNWILFFNLAGYDYLPEERVNYQIKDILDIAQRVGVEVTKAIGKVSANDILSVAQWPSEDPYWRLRYKGACHDIFFLTIYDRLPELVSTMFNTVDEAGYPATDLGIYLQPVVQGTSCHCEFNLFYDPEDPHEVDRIKLLSTNAIKRLMAKGAFFSRPYGESANIVVNRDAATLIALKKVKSFLDPNNIMNPGKLYS